MKNNYTMNFNGPVGTIETVKLEPMTLGEQVTELERSEKELKDKLGTIKATLYVNALRRSGLKYNAHDYLLLLIDVLFPNTITDPGLVEDLKKAQTKIRGMETLKGP